MQQEIGTLCKTARQEAGITQESAAERLYISVTTLQAIERGDREPQPAMISRMVDLYNKPMLALLYVRACAAEVGTGIIPDVSDRPLALSVIQLVNRIYQFADAHKDRRLMEIAEDGVIDQQERQDYDQILSELSGIIQAAMELRCH
jgi:transcriptional regulator with XRE-family HTH domain